MKYAILLIVALASLNLQSCESCSKTLRHLKSSAVGLNREITLYSSNGEIIRQWNTTSVLECGGSGCSWIGDDNKEYKISGTFVVVEK